MERAYNASLTKQVAAIYIRFEGFSSVLETRHNFSVFHNFMIVFIPQENHLSVI
jgi:hypothetical protein